MFKTETNYTYIVIETSGQRCFYSKDMDLTDVFADVMRLGSLAKQVHSDRFRLGYSGLY